METNQEPVEGHNAKEFDNGDDAEPQPGPSTSAGAEGGQAPSVDPLHLQQKKYV